MAQARQIKRDRIDPGRGEPMRRRALFALLAATARSQLLVVQTSPDASGLMALFRATNGSSWERRRGWGTDSLHCMWEGVTCLRGSEQVLWLDLADNNLDGVMTPLLWEGSLLLLGHGYRTGWLL